MLPDCQSDVISLVMLLLLMQGYLHPLLGFLVSECERKKNPGQASCKLQLSSRGGEWRMMDGKSHTI